MLIYKSTNIIGKRKWSLIGNRRKIIRVDGIREKRFTDLVIGYKLYYVTRGRKQEKENKNVKK